LSSLNKTILLTTHYMAEAEELCQRIAIINNGRIMVMDSPDALKRRISGDSVIEVTVPAAKSAMLMEMLGRLDGKKSIELINTGAGEDLHPHMKPEKALELLSPYINTDSILGIEVRSQTLEDVYITIIQGEKA
jgi:ABC-2 type transport system ATP-binding protein